METRKKFDRNHPPFGSIVNRERKSSWWNKFIKGEQSSSAPMAGGSEELNFCLLYVPYINQEVIKLCKKLIYSYSTRLAFHMPGFYLLTIFNSLLWSWYLESYPSHILETLNWNINQQHFGWNITSNIWFPHLGLHSLVRLGGGLGCPIF